MEKKRTAVLSWASQCCQSKHLCGIAFLPSRCATPVGPEQPTGVASEAEVSAGKKFWSSHISLCWCYGHTFCHKGRVCIWVPLASAVLLNAVRSRFKHCHAVNCTVNCSNSSWSHSLVLAEAKRHQPHRLW